MREVTWAGRGSCSLLLLYSWSLKQQQKHPSYVYRSYCRHNDQTSVRTGRFAPVFPHYTRVSRQFTSTTAQNTAQVSDMDSAEEQLRSAVTQMQSDLQTCLTLVTRLYEENQRLRSGLDQILQRPAPSQKEPNKRFVLKMPSILKNRKLSTSSESSETAAPPSLILSSCQRCELQAQELRHTLSEMEAFYKDKLTEARSALKEKEEQLRSFKDRVAENMVVRTSMNQSRLTEMYQQLRVCTWPNIHFSSSDSQARTLVQDMFRAAAEHMKTVTETVCGGQAASVKVEKFRQTALENLQLALFHSSREDVFKVAFPQFQAAPEDQLLASECYWLGCLMALNSPPLCPDWDGADEQSGTVFPRELRSQRRQNK